MEVDEVVHFSTGEPIARVSRANGGLIQRDARKAQRARDALRAIPIDDLIARVGQAGELYMNATLPMGDGTQTPDEFAHAQSASTGLPERMCRANMKKNAFVLGEMRSILESLTRGLSLDVLATGHGEERGVPISYQVQSPVLGSRPAVEFAWRAHAVAADHPDAGGAGAEAGTAGAVDAVPDGRCVLRSRHSAAPRSPSIRAARTLARPCSTPAPAASSSAAHPPLIATAGTLGCRRMVRASRRFCSATIRSIGGRTTST